MYIDNGPIHVLTVSSDKLVPGLGFGAKFPDGTVGHEFSLTGDPSNPYCAGIPGLISAYQRTLSTVQLWGKLTLDLIRG